MTDTIDTQELRRLLAAATPGPWTCDNRFDVEAGEGDIHVASFDGDNGPLVAAAVNSLEPLLDRLAAAETEIKTLEMTLDGVKALYEQRIAALEAAGDRLAADIRDELCGECESCIEKAKNVAAWEQAKAGGQA